LGYDFQGGDDRRYMGILANGKPVFEVTHTDLQGGLPRLDVTIDGKKYSQPGFNLVSVDYSQIQSLLTVGIDEQLFFQIPSGYRVGKTRDGLAWQLKTFRRTAKNSQGADLFVEVRAELRSEFRRIGTIASRLMKTAASLLVLFSSLNARVPESASEKLDEVVIKSNFSLSGQASSAQAQSSIRRAFESPVSFSKVSAAAQAEGKVLTANAFFYDGKLVLQARAFADVAGSFFVIAPTSVEWSEVEKINQELPKGRKIIPVRSYAEARSKLKEMGIEVMHVFGTEADSLELLSKIADRVTIWTKNQVNRLLASLEEGVLKAYETALWLAHSA